MGQDSTPSAARSRRVFDDQRDTLEQFVGPSSDAKSSLESASKIAGWSDTDSVTLPITGCTETDPASKLRAVMIPG